jgi:hypothetical protein
VETRVGARQHRQKQRGPLYNSGGPYLESAWAGWRDYGQPAPLSPEQQTSFGENQERPMTVAIRRQKRTNERNAENEAEHAVLCFPRRWRARRLCFSEIKVST